MSDPPPRKAEILARLDEALRRDMVSGFAHPGDHVLLRQLEAEGRVRVWAGEGKDHGLLLAHLTPKRFRVVAGGGDVA